MLASSFERALRGVAHSRPCARCASVLVLGEYDARGAVSSATRAAVTAAGRVGGPIHVLLAGVGAKAATASAAQVAGVERVLYSEEAAVSHGMAEGLAALLQDLQAKRSAWREGGWGAAQAPAALFPLMHPASYCPSFPPPPHSPRRRPSKSTRTF